MVCLFTQVIEEYPSQPDPEIFGLHKNAEITGAENETYELFSTVLSMQPRQVLPRHGSLQCMKCCVKIVMYEVLHINLVRGSAYKSRGGFV